MKPIATAYKLSKNLGIIKDDADKNMILWLCHQTDLYGEIYIAAKEDVLKIIDGLGYRLPKKGNYYIFKSK